MSRWERHISFAAMKKMKSVDMIINPRRIVVDPGGWPSSSEDMFEYRAELSGDECVAAAKEESLEAF